MTPGMVWSTSREHVICTQFSEDLETDAKEGKDDPISSSPVVSHHDSRSCRSCCCSAMGCLATPARALHHHRPRTLEVMSQRWASKNFQTSQQMIWTWVQRHRHPMKGFAAPPWARCVNCREFMLEAKRQGAGEFLVALAALTLAFHFIGYMNDILVAELNLQAPKASDVMDRFWNFYETHPILCLSTNFGIAILLGTAFLYLEELKDFFSRVRDRAAKQKYGYHELDEQNEELPRHAAQRDVETASVITGALSSAHADVDTMSVVTGAPSEFMQPGVSENEEAPKTVAELEQELRLLTMQAEEFEIQFRVQHRKGQHKPDAKAAHEELKELQRRCNDLRAQVMGKPAVEDVGKVEAHVSSSPSFFTRLMKSAILQILARSANGIFSVAVYFADLISDLQVSVLLLNTGNYTWAAIGIFLLCFQFFVVQIRVLPYLQSTFGSTSTLYLFFLFFGFPFGLLALDALMFCEPFGLLAILPFPEWLRQFVPAYKATRIIAEVVIESLPQCLLQSYIYVVVIYRTKAGTASASETAMLDFASVLPMSIIISTIAMLKLWIEVVSGARAAGLTIHAKAIQLWEVGAGLPLDALKKGTIVEWKCPYTLEGQK